MLRLDTSATQMINGLAGRYASLDLAMIWVSSIGVPLLALAVAAQWWRSDDGAHVRHVLVAAGLSFILGLVLNQFVLLFIHRMRPYDGGLTHLLVERSADFSFPSDHSTAAFAIAAAFLLHGMRRPAILFFLAAALVAFSRVYVGIHYLGDVLGGAVTGIIAALLVRRVYREGTRIDRLVTGIL